MSIGKKNFSGGVTTRTRVEVTEAAAMAVVSGYDASDGSLRPEPVVGVLSDAALGAVPPQVPFAYATGGETRVVVRDGEGHFRVLGTDGMWSSIFNGDTYTCIFSQVYQGDDKVNSLAAAVLENGDPIQFAETESGITAGVTYYVKNNEYPTTYDFSISLTPDGPAVDCTTVQYSVNQLITVGEQCSAPKESAPIRLHELIAYASEDRLMAFEPDSPGTKERPLSIKSPEDYADANAAEVTVNSAYPPATCFSLGTTESTSFRVPLQPGHDHAVLGCTVAEEGDLTEGMQYLQVGYGCPASMKCFTLDLGEDGTDLTGKQYLILDVRLEWSAHSPSLAAMGLGKIDYIPIAHGKPKRVTQEQWEAAVAAVVEWEKARMASTSGFNLTLYSDQDCTEALRSYELPGFNEQGLTTRIAIHLGGLSGKVYGLSIDTAESFIPLPELAWWKMWFYAKPFSADWKFTGNVLLPTVVYDESPWTWRLPPDPGPSDTSSTAVLEAFPNSFASFKPERPQMRYVWCNAGKSVLGSPDYEYMVSNPSDPSAEIFADPWCHYTIEISPPGVSTTFVSEYGDYATHYLIYRSLYDGWSGMWGDYQYVGAVETGASELTLVDNGDERKCTLSHDSNAVTCERHGLRVGDAFSFITNAGGVVAGTIYYVETVPSIGTFTFSESKGGGAYTIQTDGENTFAMDRDPLLEGVEVPSLLELSNDYASTARYLTVSQGRVWAACLDRDGEKWDRPTAIQVSSEGKHWAYPTTVNDDSPVTDGTELDGYAQTGSEVRGLLARNENVFVFLDNEFFVVRGDTPLGTGYTFTRADAIGCVSARTLVDCRSAIIWHSGAHFYAYSGGLAQPISQHRIDSSKIEWSAPHGALCWREKYVCLCQCDGNASVITHDLTTGGWRVRSSEAYAHLMGICTSGDGDRIYGVTDDGEVVDLFGADLAPDPEDRGVDYGADKTEREVSTQYWEVSAPGEDVLLEAVALEVETDSESGETLEITVCGQGRVSRTVQRSLVVSKDRSFYEVGLGGLMADAAKVSVCYTGTCPPVIHYLGLTTGAQAAG